ncbi:hypothetical protein DE146DRAFT_146547 [Phaeosphaeria sp. MPI-PUGE-AT-0046c]|nr:hypothetical protein DE146DRAFT_146547 [Phaeosphaeria sp. MPI-PUGE-AT-0046c]
MQQIHVAGHGDYTSQVIVFQRRAMQSCGWLSISLAPCLGLHSASAIQPTTRLSLVSSTKANTTALKNLPVIPPTLCPSSRCVACQVQGCGDHRATHSSNQPLSDCCLWLPRPAWRGARDEGLHQVVLYVVLLVNMFGTECGSAEQTPDKGGDEAGGHGLTCGLGEGQVVHVSHINVACRHIVLSKHGRCITDSRTGQSFHGTCRCKSMS